MALFSVLFLNFTAMGAVPVEPGADASLSIHYRYDLRVLPGVKFSLYRVAAVNPDVTFTLTPKFSAYPIRTEDQTVESWNEQAVQIKGYVQADGISPDYELVTNSDGDASTALATGLYLVLGEKKSIGGYTYIQTPSLVCVPMISDTDEWMYDYAIIPKVTRSQDPVPPKPDPPVYPEDEKEPPKTERRLILEWDDGGDAASRPKSVPFTLMADGVPVSNIELTADMGWKYVWKDLPEYDAAGHKIEYTLSLFLDGYELVRDQIGGTFRIVAKKDFPDGSGGFLPQTGLVWWPVPVLLILGILMVSFGLYRRKEDGSL